MRKPKAPGPPGTQVPDDLPPPDLSSLLPGAGAFSTPGLYTPEIDLTQLDSAALEALERVRPDLRKQFDLLRSLQAQYIQLKAATAAGFAVDDPVLFFTQVLGKQPTDAARRYDYSLPVTPDQLRVIASVKENKYTAVPAGFGVGKTILLAWLVLWFLYGKEGSIVVTTAPTWTQVEKLLWSEIRAAWRGSRIPLRGKLLETEIKVADDPRWFAIGLSTDDESRFRGFHARRVLVVFDEATGIREELWDAAAGITVGPQDKIVAIGNPTDPSSRFKSACDSGMWNVVRLDCRTHPNVVHDDPNIVPGAVTREWVDERREEYGGEDSPLFLARVAGIWPGVGQNSLISMAWIESASRWKETNPNLAQALSSERGVALGLDVAGPGQDLAVLSAVESGILRILWWTAKLDIMELVGRVVNSVSQLGGRARTLAIDDTGIGNGVSSRLIELQRYARPAGGPRYPVQLDNLNRSSEHLLALTVMRVGFGQHSPDPKRFWRMKDYMWWRMREALRRGQLGLPTEAQFRSLGFPRGNSLTAQLATPIYEVLSNGAIKVWDKRDGEREKTKSLPSRSPDIAHSAILANHAWRAVRPQLDQPRAQTFLEQRKEYLAGVFRDIRKGRDPQEEREMQGPEIYKYLE